MWQREIDGCDVTELTTARHSPAGLRKLTTSYNAPNYTMSSTYIDLITSEI